MLDLSSFNPRCHDCAAIQLTTFVLLLFGLQILAEAGPEGRRALRQSGHCTYIKTVYEDRRNRADSQLTQRISFALVYACFLHKAARRLTIREAFFDPATLSQELHTFSSSES